MVGRTASDGPLTLLLDDHLTAANATLHYGIDDTDPFETFGKGRVCPNDGTIISQYNPHDFCWLCVSRIDRSQAEEIIEGEPLPDRLVHAGHALAPLTATCST